MYNNWALAAEQKTAEGLNRPLVVRCPKNSTLKVNFGRETLAILMETKILKKDFPNRDVPKKAQEIFKRFDDFRNYNNSLDQMVTLYNFLRIDTCPEEFRLISDEMAQIDKSLHDAEKVLTWNTSDIWEYIEGIRKACLDLNGRVKQAQGNVVKIDNEINQWCLVPLFTRTDEEGKPNLLDLEGREAKKVQRYKEIGEAAVKVQALVSEIEELYKIAEAGERLQKKWRKYLQYVDYMISDALLITIARSVGYLLDQTDAKADIDPLFTVRLELNDPDIIFRPSLDKAIMHNFFDLTVSIMDDIFQMAALVPRIAIPEDGSPSFEPNNYLQVVSEHEELSGLKKMFVDRVELVIEQANADRLTYMDYSYLWTESRQEFMFYFLNFSRMLNEDEVAMFEEEEKSIKKCHPVLAQFKEQIDHYEGIHDEADKIEPIKVFEKWFKAEIRPFKQV